MNQVKRKTELINKLMWRQFGKEYDFKKAIERSLVISIEDLIKMYPKGVSENEMQTFKVQLESAKDDEEQYYKRLGELGMMTLEELEQCEEEKSKRRTKK